MASTEIEFQPKQSREGFGARFTGFFYDSETGACCGRTAASWGKITIFYVIYYLALAGFFTGMMYIFFETISDVEPKQTKYESILKLNPGMGFRPQLTYESTLIKFKQGDEDSIKEYVENIQVFLDQYDASNEKNEGAVKCDSGKDSVDTACLFDIKQHLGDECTKAKDFGYYMGTPCVLLKLNKIFDWEPEYYSNDTVPSDVADTYGTDGVTVTCTGTNHRDSDNLGAVEFYPAAGFLSTFFPFRNQKGYQAPIVMARFKQLEPGVLVQVWCKAWAKNIYHHKNDKMGSVHFEILMD